MYSRMKAVQPAGGDEMFCGWNVGGCGVLFLWLRVDDGRRTACRASGSLGACIGQSSVGVLEMGSLHTALPGYLTWIILMRTLVSRGNPSHQRTLSMF
jgi:hypothetical protein